MALKKLLTDNNVSQADFARGIDRSTAFVAMLVNGGTGASQDTIERALAFLSQRLGRKVTYEEAFSSRVGRGSAAVA
jgi:transcriptional regulator with XRE-family HTH domain